MDAESLSLPAAAALGGSPLVIRARGWSMWPSLRDGDVLVLDRSEGGRLRPGEIAAYVFLDDAETGYRLICHRVLWDSRRPDGGGIAFKGDALCRIERIEASAGYRLLGRVVSVVRNDRMIRLDGRIRSLFGLVVSFLLWPAVAVFSRGRERVRRAAHA